LIRETSTGVEITIRVVPRARHSHVAGTRGDALLVRLTSAPVDGAANAALVDLLSRHLGVPRSAIQIVTGERSRSKRVAIAGTTIGAVKRSLNL
jgi:hypothetical protein